MQDWEAAAPSGKGRVLGRNPGVWTERERERGREGVRDDLADWTAKPGN